MSYQAPEYAPWDGRRVPVTLLSGYLGAGKTTLINEMLVTTTQPITVLVNDVGAINIDAALIRRRNADTVELTDGCVCCSLSGGIADAFQAMIERSEPPAHVVIELSGVADPARVLPWARTAGFRLDGVVVALDPTAPDEVYSELSRATMDQQIRAADLVLVTKLDTLKGAGELAVAEAIEGATERCRRLAPTVPVVAAPSATATSRWLALGGLGPGTTSPPPPATLFDAHRVEMVPLPNPINPSLLEPMMQDLPRTVVRAKGIAAGYDGERYRVERVGKRHQVVRLSAAERVEPTALTVIHTTDSQDVSR